MAKRIPKPLVPSSTLGRASSHRTKLAADVAKKPLSRQRQSQIRKSARGICQKCSKPVVSGYKQCQFHIDYSRNYSKTVSAAMKLYKAVQGAQ